MRRFTALAVLALLAACSREQPAPAPVTPPPPTAEAPPVTPAAPASSGNETEAATRSQESGDAGSDRTASDVSLENMAGAGAGAGLPPGKWQPGVNYTVLVPAQPTSVAPGKVEVMEVFWLACPHCYALEPFLQGWLKNKPPYVEFVRVPVIWQPLHRAHAHLFYTLQALGRNDLIAKAFETIAQQHVLLASQEGDEDESLKLAQKFATDNGVSADDFTKAWNSFTVNADMRRAEDLTGRYHVESVPFIIVNGKYTTDVGRAGGEAKLIELIGDLSAAEKSH